MKRLREVNIKCQIHLTYRLHAEECNPTFYKTAMGDFVVIGAFGRQPG